jgi:tetratricopeptide (TPR) repeat protein
MSGRSVFISHARSTSMRVALALREALGDICFIDACDVEPEEDFPEAITDAVLDARVFVAILSNSYFDRWHCVREWSIACKALSGSGTLNREMLTHLVVAIHSDIDTSSLLALPPVLQRSNLVSADDTASLARLINEKLTREPRSLRARMWAEGRESDIASLRYLSTIPLLPRSTAGIPVWPHPPCLSLGERFFGRTDLLWRLHYSLIAGTKSGFSEDRSRRVVGLHGVGGAGKTQLAREYALRMGPRLFRGGIFWVNASGEAEPLAQQFQHIIRVLTGCGSEVLTGLSDGDLRQRLVAAVEAASHNEPVLFVVDNIPEAADPGRSAQSLTKWCPVVGVATCIVTSRRRFLDTETLLVEPLDLDSSIAVLRWNVRSATAIDTWESLANAVGSLPVALGLLNAAFRAEALTPEAVKRSIREHEVSEDLDTISRLLSDEYQEESLRGMTTAFMASYQALPSGAAALAARCAYLAAAPIGRPLVDALSTDVGRGAVSTLVARAFLVPVDGDGTALEMHRVLSSYIRMVVHPDAAATIEPLVERVLALLESQASHSFQELEKALLAGSTHVATLAEWAKGLGLARDNLVQLHRACSRYDRANAASHLQRALNAVGEADPELRSVLLTELAMIQMTPADPKFVEAAASLERAGEALRELCALEPTERLHRANVIANRLDLALVLWRSGNLTEAERASAAAVDELGAMEAAGDVEPVLMRTAGVLSTLRAECAYGRGDLPTALALADHAEQLLSSLSSPVPTVASELEFRRATALEVLSRVYDALGDDGRADSARMRAGSELTRVENALRRRGRLPLGSGEGLFQLVALARPDPDDDGMYTVLRATSADDYEVAVFDGPPGDGVRTGGMVLPEALARVRERMWFPPGDNPEALESVADGLRNSRFQMDQRPWIETEMEVRERLIALDPSNVNWRWRHAECLLALSRVDIDMSLFDQAREAHRLGMVLVDALLALSPDNQSWRLGLAGQLLDYAHVGRAVFSLSELESLVERARGLLEQQPDTRAVDRVKRLAILYFICDAHVTARRGELNEARRKLDECLEAYSGRDAIDLYGTFRIGQALGRLYEDEPEFAGSYASRALNAYRDMQEVYVLDDSEVMYVPILLRDYAKWMRRASSQTEESEALLSNALRLWKQLRSEVVLSASAVDEWAWCGMDAANSTGAGNRQAAVAAIEELIEMIVDQSSRSASVERRCGSTLALLRDALPSPRRAWWRFW